MVKFSATWRWGGFSPQGLAVGALLVGISACSSKPSDSPDGQMVVSNDAGSTPTDASNVSASTDASKREPVLVTLGEFVGGVDTTTGEFWMKPASEVSDSSYGGQAHQGVLSTYDSGTFGTGVTGTGSNYIALEQVSTSKVPQGSGTAWDTTNCGSPAPTSGICAQIRMRNLFPNQPIIRAYVEFTSLTAYTGTTGLTTRSYLTLPGIGITDSDYGVTSANGGLFRYGRLARSGASSGNTASVYWPFTCTNTGGCSFSWRGVVKGQLLDPVVRSSLANGTADLPSSGTYGGGTAGDDSSGQPAFTFDNGDPMGTRTAVSQDGRYVVFQSLATNLPSSPGTGFTAVYRRDTTNGTTELVNLKRDGTAPTNCDSAMPSISNDGSKVAFVSTCQLDSTNDTDALIDVYVRDMSATTNKTYLISVANGSTTTKADQHSYNPFISGDGTVVVFDTNATNLTSGFPGGRTFRDVYRRTNYAYTASTLPSGGRTFRVSMPTGSTTWVNGDSTNASMAASGSTWVIFESTATDLVSGDTNGFKDVFTRNLSSSTTTRVSVSSTGAQLTGFDSQNGAISSGGQYIAFDTQATVLSGVSATSTQVYVRGISDATSVKLASGSAGSQTTVGNGTSSHPVLSGGTVDGRYVAYLSTSTDVTSPSISGSNGGSVFIYDRYTSDSGLVASNVVSVPETFTFLSDTTVSTMDFPSLGISKDGNYVVFPADPSAPLVGSSSFAQIYRAPTF